MRKYLLPDDKPYFKANIHAHSTVSDGRLTPLELKEAYKSKGYSILSLTDHEILKEHSELSDDEFLMLTGVEVGIKEDREWSPDTKCCHLNLYARNQYNTDLPGFEKEYSVKGINRIISEAKDAGFIVCYNHPVWSLEDVSVCSQYKGMFGMEIFNTGSYVGGLPEQNIREYDAMLRAGSHIACVAADDCHCAYPEGHRFFDMYGGWIYVAASSLTYDNIINALEKGDFYASCGPEIYELYIEDDTVKLTSSEVCEITMVTGTRKCARLAVDCETPYPITHAEIPIKRELGYVRFELTDKEGKKANTKAYFL